MLVDVPDSVSLTVATEMLESMPEFATAEPNAVDDPFEFTPDDPSYGTQWGFTKTRADEAWVISRGGGILIGMLDTGADLDHPDLQANLWKRSFTISLPFLGSITFNYLGFDMVDGDFVPEACATLTCTSASCCGHGTHVAGTIAAVTDNATQVAGMAPDATVMVFRTLGPGGGAHSQFADAVRKAADMGVKIISYSGGGSASATKKNAVDYAVGKGVLFIAAAGNGATSSTTSAFPGAYSNVMAIGNTTSTDARSGTSNFGSWVAMAAPGTSILSTWLSGGTNTISGTSMATPHVSGAAALIWSRNPSMTASQVRQRLLGTAKPLNSTLQLGAGRLDAFSGVFNSGFELGTLASWDRSGTAASVTGLGPLSPREGSRMALISTGPAATNISTEFGQAFTVQSGVSNLPIQFRYNFVTEEYPEWVGTEFNDCTLIQLEAPDGSIHDLAFESVNSSSFSSVGGIDFPGGDNTVGMTGWRTVAVDIPVTQGPGEYRVVITDAGDDIFDSVLLLDDIRFKSSVATVSPSPAPSCGGF
jgi:subtilisin family serine protease